MRALCVSVHDVSPATWSACRTVLSTVSEVDASLPVTLLVVPDYHGLGYAVPAWYRAWLAARMTRGDEVALHGYTHRDDAPAGKTLGDRLRRRFYTAGEGEFAAVSRDTAMKKIAAGNAWCAAQGLRPGGFVAPAWLMSRGTWEALRSFDFTYTTTLGRFHLLRERRSINALSLVYSARSPWRRWTSRQWNSMLARAMRDAPLVRLGLHPADAEHPELMEHVRRIVDYARRGRQALTKLEFAQQAQRTRSV
ncbi:MAG TPA: polysaccharide deacetylase family protein [Burkholderiales bacterium]|nr:polysaccharide deacetylase family protein [Burkholderiales bacterium]